MLQWREEQTRTNSITIKTMYTNKKMQNPMLLMTVHKALDNQGKLSTPGICSISFIRFNSFMMVHLLSYTSTLQIKIPGNRKMLAKESTVSTSWPVAHTCDFLDARLKK